MESSENKVTGCSRGQGELNRFQIAQFADEQEYQDLHAKLHGERRQKSGCGRRLRDVAQDSFGCDARIRSGLPP